MRRFAHPASKSAADLFEPPVYAAPDSVAWVGFPNSVLKDESYLFLHRTVVRGRLDSQALFHRVIEVTNEYGCHDTLLMIAVQSLITFCEVSFIVSS